MRRNDDGNWSAPTQYALLYEYIILAIERRLAKLQLESGPNYSRFIMLFFWHKGCFYKLLFNLLVIFFKLIVKVLQLPAVGDFEKQMYRVINNLNMKKETLKTTETPMVETVY